MLSLYLIADWTGTGYHDRRNTSKYQSQFGGGTQYAYFYEEDESTFSLVNNTRDPRPAYQRGRFQRNMRNLRGRGGSGRGTNQNQFQVVGKALKAREQTNNQRQQKRWPMRPGMRNQAKSRNPSVTVRSDWVTVEEMDFPRLAKLNLPNIQQGQDLVCCGSLEFYDKAYERVNVRNQKALKRVDRIFHTVTTTDDPVIRRLSKIEGNVYATDIILATLMCSTRSTYSWDIVVEKIGNKLFFDKRDNAEFDLLTVNETSVEPPEDDGTSSLNSPRNLALEATFINHNYSQQVLKTGEPHHKFDEPNPFISEEDTGEVASVAYRYRKWDLGDGVVVVVRCEHDAVMQGPDQQLQFVTIKALNEWNSKTSAVEWRQKLDSQRGAVLANELRNNACKLAKWTAQALLAESNQLKFGYVSRALVGDSTKHVILGTQQYKPAEFATQINLNMANAWGIIRCIVDICLKQEDGKYLLMKDPNKPLIRLYNIPNNSFESEDDEEYEDY